MQQESRRPLVLTQTGGLTLRYGENPWQGAQLFSQFSDDPLELGKFVLEEGETPSGTNLTDVDRGIKTLTHIDAANTLNNGGIREYVAVALKHGNCCGAGVGNNPFLAFSKMIEGDLQAIMGAAVLVNFRVDQRLASQLLYYKSPTGRRLLDLVAAPLFSKEARNLLARTFGRCRLLSNPALGRPGSETLDTSLKTRGVRKGHLVQDADNRVLDFNDPRMQVFGVRNSRYHRDLGVASAICRTSNSNTITLVQNGMLLGQGVGQTRRDRAARLAVAIAFENRHHRDAPYTHRLPEHTVAVSDSFFPFKDGVEPLLEAGVSAIFSTSGALRDKEVQAACRDADVLLYQLPDIEARMFFGH